MSSSSFSLRPSSQETGESSDLRSMALGALHSSFQQELPLSPTVADIHARRSISDSVLRPGQSRNTLQYNNQNTQFMMVARSGGSTVKLMLQEIRAACDAREQASSSSAVAPPDRECCILAQWAADSYYRIVIAGNNGIPLIVRAMALFASHRGLQECGCLALGNLCSDSGGNLSAVQEAGGLAHIVRAMKQHSQSVAVQSAACDALRNMCALLVAHRCARKTDEECFTDDLMTALSHAKEMHLLPKHRRLASELLAIVSMNAAPAKVA